MFKGSKTQLKIATFCFDMVSIFATAALAIAICFTFFFRTVVVDGSSMNPTLTHGDRLIITAVAKDYKYGDIVVCSQPNPMEKTLIKRVIATEGQKVTIDFVNGVVKVDGVELDEPYIAEKTYREEGIAFNNTVVPERCVFVMGDNRNNSTDSRSPMVGFIDTNYIMGRVLFRLSPQFDMHVADF